MAKFVALWHRAEDVDRFERRYRERHLPLAAAMPAAAVETSRVVGDGPWMWMTEVRFPSLDAARRALTSPAGDAARADAQALSVELDLQYDTFLADDVAQPTLASPPATILDPDDGDAYWFGTARMTVKARASVSGTAIIEMILPGGGSAPLHVHENLDDTFFVLEGRLRIWCDGETSTLRPGAYAQLPRGIPHSILADGGPVRALLIHASDEMIDFIEAAGTPLSAATTPPPFSSEHVAAAALRHGQRVIGPAPFPSIDAH